ncbi:response regulator [Geomonas sp. RF6]|uniref:response regulator n=1 Tax=Geomonas sp. RF6 TaxID=2897342 RepID=UPI001E3468DF|nr:response regulator [Geomonas sp. RF6]UFS70853.1 response regulator [Geomonas sp. RF6]
MEKLLIVEESEKVRCQLKGGLGGEYLVVESASYTQGKEEFFRHTPKLVVLDLEIPQSCAGSHGFLLLEEMLTRHPSTKVVLLTGYGQRAPAYRAISCGAYDYCLKPVQLDDLRAILRRAMQLLVVEGERSRLQKVLLRMMAEAPWSGDLESMNGDGLTGKDPLPLLTLREARDMVERGAIMAAVDNSRGNLVKASEILGVCRPTLYDLMKKHGLHKSTRHVWRGEQDPAAHGAERQLESDGHAPVAGDEFAKVAYGGETL